MIEVGELDRSTYLGSSDVAAILGVGAYGSTPLTVYLKKIGERADVLDEQDRLFLTRRKRWEGPIVEMLKEEFDGQINRINQRYVDGEFDFLAAEIDFEWSDNDGAIQNGEIKTCSPFNFGERQGWGEAGSADIPVHYAAQVAFALGVTGREVCIIAAMVGLDSMVFYRMDRDEETIAEIRRRCVRFWNEHVLKRVPPAPISLADCQRLTMRMRGRPVEADEQLLKDIKAADAIRASIRTMKGEEEDVKLRIAQNIIKQWGLKTEGPMMAKDNAIIMHGGVQIASWNIQSATRLQATALKIEMPEIYQQFSKTSASRVLRIK